MPHGTLRKRSREAMEQWRQFLVRTVRRSIKNHEMRPDADPEQVGTVFEPQVREVAVGYRILL